MKTANAPVRKAQEYANSLKIRHFGIFSTYLDRRFLITCPDFPCVLHPLGSPVTDARNWLEWSP
jgi:hypothetical protein